MDAERIKSIIEPVTKSYGVEVIEISKSYIKGGTMLKIFVDKKIKNPVPVPYPGSSVNLNLLENLSREISSVLDAYGIEEKRLILEVSSPGLDRLIPNPDELKFFIDHEMKISLKLPVNGRKNFTGRLVAVEEENQTSTLTLKAGEEYFKLNNKDIESIRLKPVFPQQGAKKKGK